MRVVAGRFEITADVAAQAWMKQHPGSARVISYEVHRCCGGGKICQVSVRAIGKRDNLESFDRGSLGGDADVFIDPRAAARLPHRFGLTVRGLGPLKHLDLDLEPDAWGTLLYD
jgi:hypothetical protein